MKRTTTIAIKVVRADVKLLCWIAANGFCRAFGISAGACIGLFIGFRVLGVITPRPKHADIEELKARVAQVESDIQKENW